MSRCVSGRYECLSTEIRERRFPLWSGYTWSLCSHARTGMSYIILFICVHMHTVSVADVISGMNNCNEYFDYLEKDIIWNCVHSMTSLKISNYVPVPFPSLKPEQENKYNNYISTPFIAACSTRSDHDFMSFNVQREWLMVVGASTASDRIDWFDFRLLRLLTDMYWPLTEEDRAYCPSRPPPGGCGETFLLRSLARWDLYMVDIHNMQYVEKDIIWMSGVRCEQKVQI